MSSSDDIDIIDILIKAGLVITAGYCFNRLINSLSDSEINELASRSGLSLPHKDTGDEDNEPSCDWCGSTNNVQTCNCCPHDVCATHFYNGDCVFCEDQG